MKYEIEIRNLKIEEVNTFTFLFDFKRMKFKKKLIGWNLSYYFKELDYEVHDSIHVNDIRPAIIGSCFKSNISFDEVVRLFTERNKEKFPSRLIQKIAESLEYDTDWEYPNGKGNLLIDTKTNTEFYVKAERAYYSANVDYSIESPLGLTNREGHILGKVMHKRVNEKRLIRAELEQKANARILEIKYLGEQND